MRSGNGADRGVFASVIQCMSSCARSGDTHSSPMCALRRAEFLFRVLRGAQAMSYELSARGSWCAVGFRFGAGRLIAGSLSRSHGIDDLAHDLQICHEIFWRRAWRHVLGDDLVEVLDLVGVG